MSAQLDLSMEAVGNVKREIAAETGERKSVAEDGNSFSFASSDPQLLILDSKIPNLALQPSRPVGLYETWRMGEALAGTYLLYGHPQVLTLAQKLACQCLMQAENLIILDGGNVFDPYLVARLAARIGREPEDFLRRIRVSRSFTCHQMLSLVRKIESASRLWRSPFILLLGPLTAFYDESVPPYEVWKLFRAFQRELNRLTASGFRLLLSCQQPSSATKRNFVQQLKVSARGIASCWEAELRLAPTDEKGNGERIQLQIPSLVRESGGGRKSRWKNPLESPLTKGDSQKPPPKSIPSPLQGVKGRLIQSSQMAAPNSLKQEGTSGFSRSRRDISRGKYLLLKVEKPFGAQRQWVLRKGEKVNSRYLSL